jgi:hypothetical protein
MKIIIPGETDTVIDFHGEPISITFTPTTVAIEGVRLDVAAVGPLPPTIDYPEAGADRSTVITYAEEEE